MSVLSSLGLWLAFAAGALLWQVTMPSCPDQVHVFVPQDCPASVILAGKRKPEPPKDLRVQLWLSRRVFIRTPADVYARIRVDDPRRVLHCPEWQIAWGENGIRSVWSSEDCDPYGAIEDRPTLHVEPREGPRRHTYHVGGEYEVKGTVRSMGQPAGSATGMVIVQGPRLP